MPAVVVWLVVDEEIVAVVAIAIAIAVEFVAAAGAENSVICTRVRSAHPESK